MSAAEQEALSRADKLVFGPGNRNVARVWGTGPLVVLVHGWGGYGGQLAPLAASLAAQGFKVVVPDITGHGASPRYGTSWRFFFRDILALEQSLGEGVHAYVGHSVGGLAMMAARHISGITASRYICICSPSYPSKGADILKERIAPSEGGMSRYKEFVANQFGGASWAQLEAGACYAGAAAETLLIYDLEDRFVSHTEGDKIQAAHPAVQVSKMRAWGHIRILTNPDLSRAVVSFLRV
jgi:hypothetical protein